MKEERIVQKFSVVYISTGDRTQVFRSVEDVPEELRQKIVRVARTSHVDTLVIANEKGREMLQSQGLEKRTSPQQTSPLISPAFRWAIIGLLLGGVLLILNWLLRFR